MMSYILDPSPAGLGLADAAAVGRPKHLRLVEGEHGGSSKMEIKLKQSWKAKKRRHVITQGSLFTAN